MIRGWLVTSVPPLPIRRKKGGGGGEDEVRCDCDSDWLTTAPAPPCMEKVQPSPLDTVVYHNVYDPHDRVVLAKP